jgi:hypothetical protein
MYNRILIQVIGFINTLCKGGRHMDNEGQNEDKPKPRPGQPEAQHYDKDGHLFIKLNIDDSALVVRSDGTIDLVSHDLENSDDGYMGDVEDLSKTFSLVLALVTALEDEELYNRIFHNLNMNLMKKWAGLDDSTKAEIVQKRKRNAEDLSAEEEKEKNKRVDDFRKRMNKYKDTFLDEMEEDKKRLKRDMQDEIEWQRKYGKDFGMRPDHLAGPEDFDEPMETRKKIKKPKRNPLGKLKGVEWNPYDKSLKAHWKEWRADESPDIEDDD